MTARASGHTRRGEEPRARAPRIYTPTYSGAYRAYSRTYSTYCYTYSNTYRYIQDNILLAYCSILLAYCSIQRMWRFTYRQHTEHTARALVRIEAHGEEWHHGEGCQAPCHRSSPLPLRAHGPLCTPCADPFDKLHYLIRARGAHGSYGLGNGRGELRWQGE